MLRDPGLIPLSHQHQHGLALCVMIERGLRDTAELAAKVADTYELELRNHFEVEEGILFPSIRESLGPAPLIDELIADHRRLEALVEQVKTGQPGALLEFASTLSGHIRREERELFEDVQKRLPRDELDRLGREIDSHVVRVCL